MKVETIQTAETAAVATAQAAATDAAAFRSALAKASSTEVPEGVKLRKGEEIEAVPGRRYAEIVKGDREGMYINTSGNKRHGEAFVLVRRNGREYHVYGSGKDRLVVGLHNPKQEASDADLNLRKGERVEPVEGRSTYVEIVSGARKGMYLNTSGNKRHGEAFVLSVKDGVERHIYGSGDDRVVVSNDRNDRNDRTEPGEKTAPVEGRKRYEEIVAGNREGMYLNTSGNARDGQAFVRVIEDDVEYHIYGSGKERLLVANDLLDDKAGTVQLQRGERIQRVEGRSRYVEIVSGPREGMYLNTSGNARHGQAFVLSVKDGVEHHVYGSGADRVVIKNER